MVVELVWLFWQVMQQGQADRVMLVGETADERVTPKQQIAPGAPPLLSFRAYEGKRTGRFSGTDLMLDDAGH